MFDPGTPDWAWDDNPERTHWEHEEAARHDRFDGFIDPYVGYDDPDPPLEDGRVVEPTMRIFTLTPGGEKEPDADVPF